MQLMRSWHRSLQLLHTVYRSCWLINVLTEFVDRCCFRIALQFLLLMQHQHVDSFVDKCFCLRLLFTHEYEITITHSFVSCLRRHQKFTDYHTPHLLNVCLKPRSFVHLRDTVPLRTAAHSLDCPLALLLSKLHSYYLQNTFSKVIVSSDAPQLQMRLPYIQWSNQKMWHLRCIATWCRPTPRLSLSALITTPVQVLKSTNLSIRVL